MLLSFSCLLKKFSFLLVILITPPPIDAIQWVPGGRSNDLIARYADVIRELGVVKDAPVVDLWNEKLLIIPGDFVDGLHMNEKGNAKILAGVKDALTTKLPELLPEQFTLPSTVTPGPLKGQYPSWLEVAGKSIEETEAIINTWVWK